MRKRKPTKGKVRGIKFTLDKNNQEEDPKEVKAQLLKELEEKEQKDRDDKEWYDKEMDKNLKQQ